MSAGAKGEYPGEAPLVVHHDLAQLAPAFRLAVMAAVEECHTLGIDAFVHESYREHATAVAYYKRGRTTKPPAKPVTNAPDETWTWHGYGLAVDVISASKGWDVPASWFVKMSEVFKRHGCKWGGDWRSKDLPHVQWAQCKASPSDEARRLLAEQGMEAVWSRVEAL